METVTINGQKYRVSTLDTEETIKNMVADRLGVLPRYLKTVTYDPEKGKIKFADLTREIGTIEPKDIIEFSLRAPADWNISKEDVALFWLDTFIPPDIDRTLEIALFDQINDAFGKISPINFRTESSIKERLQRYRDRSQRELLDLRATVERNKKFKEKYTAYKPVETTSFIQDAIVVDYQLTLDSDPLGVFEDITLTEAIPYVRLNLPTQQYYKVYKGIIPDQEWLSAPGTLHFKIAREDEYNEIIINYTSNVEPYDATMSLTASTTGDKAGGTMAETLKDLLFSIMPGVTIKVTDKKISGIRGVFAVPGFTIAREVFIDLITNDPMVGHYIYIDEIRKLSSRKKTFAIHYAPAEQEDMTVNLSQKTVSRKDPFYLAKELPLFTPYLNVRIKLGRDLTQVNRFKDAFARILDLYTDKFSSVIKEYSSVIPGFKESQMVTRQLVSTGGNLKDLQAQDSELFIYGYPTKCEKKQQPIPIKKSAIKKWKAKGRQVMNYPKGSDNYFVCPHDKYPYPGLLNNKLDNKDLYDYLPCCYPEDQKTGRKTWNLYLQDKTKKKGGKPKSANIILYMALTADKLGYLPKNIYNVLSLDSKYKFYRYGVHINNNSFIHAVLLALDESYEKQSDKEKYVTAFRESTLPTVDFSNAVQELYNSTEENLAAELQDPNVVFDSKRFIGLLEGHFDCQIIVFERSERYPNGEFELPLYTQGYLYKKLQRHKATVFIYKHMGRRSDHLSKPHYELIIGKTGNKTIGYFQDLPIISRVEKYRHQYYQLSILDCCKYRAQEYPFKTKIRHQMIDRYGKNRGFVFKDGVIMRTPPGPPRENIAIAEISNQDQVIPQKIIRFIKLEGLNIIKQDISNDDRLIGLEVALGTAGMTGYIPMIPTSPFKDFPKERNFGLQSSGVSVIDKTVYNRKVAEFLKQYLLYAFSKWFNGLTEHQQEQRKIESLPIKDRIIQEASYLGNRADKFLKTELVHRSEHRYNLRDLPRQLTLNNSFFYKGKLVVASKVLQKRLAYYLHFMLNKSRVLVADYEERVYLDNYYTYASDFTQKPEQLVFIGYTSISNWLTAVATPTISTVMRLPQPDVQKPYFFTHWSIYKGKPVLIQNVRDGSKKRALSVCDYYQKNDVNLGYNTPELADISEYTVYDMVEGSLRRRTKGDSPTCKLLKYGPGKYGAMLKV